MRKIYSSLDEAVRDLYGNERSVARRRRITGGDINEACALTLDDGTTLFMKYNSSDAFLNLEAEAIGLTEIAATRTIGAAKLLGLGKDRNCAFLLLEFIEGERSIEGYWDTFANELASMHKAPVSHPEVGYGFYMDNFIGMRKQINTPSTHRAGECLSQWGFSRFLRNGIHITCGDSELIVRSTTWLMPVPVRQ